MAISSTIYNIDFSLVGERLSPPNKRNPIYLAYLSALVEPLQVLRDEIFDVYRPDVVFRTRYNSQTIVLTAILNKVFDVQSASKIYIDNTDNNISINHFYNQSEGYPAIYFSNISDAEPTYFFNIGEYQSDYDFLVYVPATWTDTNSNERTFEEFEQQIISEIEKYRIMGVNYTLISY